jgi:uncharacterized coiled-coil protein SlyX
MTINQIVGHPHTVLPDTRASSSLGAMPMPHEQLSPDDGPDRAALLEEKLTFQQRQLDELNAVVISQQEELARLRREVARLGGVVQDVLATGTENLPHEKPPHY